MISATWIAIPLAGLTVLSTLLGGYFAFRVGNEIHTLIALSGGIVVAVALFDVLPEAMDAVGDARRVGSLIGAGFLDFFLIQRLLVLHHRDEPDEAKAHAHPSWPRVGLTVVGFCGTWAIAWAATQ